MPSFDVVSEVDLGEVRNAVDQANKEISNRFDFKGSDSRVELREKVLTLFAEDAFRLEQIKDVLMQRLSRRGVDVRNLEEGAVQKISGNKIKKEVTIRVGVRPEVMKMITKVLKEQKGLKVQSSIQGDTVRISGAKKDHLQQAIAAITHSVSDHPLQYVNFRD